MVTFYRRGSILPIEESHVFELKAHRQLSDTDLSKRLFSPTLDGGWEPKLPKQRRSLSRTFCGMLNTGNGGIVFLGVTDSGRADGFLMSRSQILSIALQVNLLRRLKWLIKYHGDLEAVSSFINYLPWPLWAM